MPSDSRHQFEHCGADRLARAHHRPQAQRIRRRGAVDRSSSSSSARSGTGTRWSRGSAASVERPVGRETAACTDDREAEVQVGSSASIRPPVQAQSAGDQNTSPGAGNQSCDATNPGRLPISARVRNQRTLWRAGRAAGVDQHCRIARPRRSPARSVAEAATAARSTHGRRRCPSTTIRCESAGQPARRSERGQRMASMIAATARCPAGGTRARRARTAATEASPPRPSGRWPGARSRFRVAAAARSRRGRRLHAERPQHIRQSVGVGLQAA